VACSQFGSPANRSIARKVDITSVESVAGFVEEVKRTYGRIDVLVNSVGWVRDRVFLEKPRAEWERAVSINLWGPINLIREVLPHMAKQKTGSVICIGSDAGRIGEFREAVYGAAKAGVISLSKSLAREHGKDNVRFNVVCPALTVPAPGDTGANSMWQDMKTTFTPQVLEKASSAYPLRRLGRAADTANTVVFLASELASFITGQTLSVNGGYCML